MPAYWLSRCKVIDPVEYKKYTDLVPSIIAKYGGKVLARGGSFDDGGPPPLSSLHRDRVSDARTGGEMQPVAGIPESRRVPPRARQQTPTERVQART